ncbi:MAG: hypothetical protein ABR926_20370 [Streptosporangiaceae bacterium]
MTSSTPPPPRGPAGQRTRQARRAPAHSFPAGSRRGLGGLHHFDLLNHPTVWIAVRGLLGNTAH